MDRRALRVAAAAAVILSILAAVVLIIVRPWSSSGDTTATPAISTAPTKSASPSASATPTPSPSETPTPSSSPSPTEAAPAPPPPAPEPAAPAVTDCQIPGWMVGRDLETISDQRVMALTFDAGSANGGVDKVLQTLQSTGTPATFFLTGAFAQKYPAGAQRIATAYPIGNHSQTHPDFTTLSDDAVRGEIQTARANIMAATGVDPRPYFRFPFGAVDARVIGLVNEQCMVPFRWTTDSLGWKGTSGGMNVDSVRARVVNGARPGGVVLFHVGANPNDGSTLDADALPGIIADLSAQGYRFVTLEHVLSAAP